MEAERATSEDGNDVGGIKLPVGFRFHPTDEELLLHYLRRKLYSLPLLPIVIPESEVFRSNPWDLPGDLKEKRYFFCKNKMRNINRSKCNSGFSTDCGFWKPTGKVDRQSMAPGSNSRVIGVKKSFVFCRVNKSIRLKTQWIMHEFSFVCSVTTPYSTQELMMQMGDWVVCCVYQRKAGKGRNHAGAANDHELASSKRGNQMNLAMMGNNNNNNNNSNRLGNLVAQDSSSSCSSGITHEICSSSDLDQDEASS